MRRIVLLAAALLPFSAVQAQWLELQPGTKVRVTAPGVLGGRVQATVGMRNTDSLSLFRPGSGPFAIPISAIRSAEVSLGKSRAHGALAGLKWGGGIGAALGVVLAVFPNSEMNTVDEYCDPSYELCETYSDLQGVAMMAVGSALIGAGVGALIGKERWQRLAAPVNVGSAPRVFIAPTTQHGVQLRVRAGF